jgi:3-oxoacyl-[acyl-carrier protein] reductase
VVADHQCAARAGAITADLPGKGHWSVQLPVDDTAVVDEPARLVGERHGKVDVFVNAAGTTRRIAHSDPTHSTMRLSTRSTRSTSAAPSPRPGPSRRFSEPPAPGFWSTSRPCTGKGSNVAYCASKAAVDTMGQSLARVLAPEVRVIAISPAAVDTGFVPGRDRNAVEAQARTTPLQILVDPDDVAVSVMGAVTHLRLATGTVVLVAGGLHLSKQPRYGSRTNRQE